MPKKRNKNRKKSILNTKNISISLLAFIAILVISSGVYSALNKHDSIGRDITYTLTGTITEKSFSCGREKLSEDGTVIRAGGICDGGNSLAVGDAWISTGGGALTGSPQYISNIKSLHPGDVVEVQYVIEKEGRKSTNCKSCYIKKSGTSQPESQTLSKR